MKQELSSIHGNEVKFIRFIFQHRGLARLLKIVEANDGLQTTDLIHKMKNSSSVYRLIAEAERLKYIYREPEQIKNKGTTRKRIFITEEGRRIVAVMKKLGLA